MLSSTCAIVRWFAVSPNTVSRAWRRFQESESYSRRAGQGCRRSLARPVSAPLCKRNRMSTARAKKITSCSPLLWMSLTKQWETDCMRVAWGLMSLSGSCAHCPELQSILFQIPVVVFEIEYYNWQVHSVPQMWTGSPLACGRRESEKPWRTLFSL